MRIVSWFLFSLLCIPIGVLGAEPMAVSSAPHLGLPPLPVPKDNLQSPEKIKLGDRLFNDKRFSSTGEVACATCHATNRGMTDSPLVTSEGINKLRGTRNAPTVLNAAFNKTQFWDGRSPSLEDQARHPFLNPVEMGLSSHQTILDVIAGDRSYKRGFRKVFGVKPADITIEHVIKAIASFERTQISGDSPFDRYYFKGDEKALSVSAKRGFDLFIADGRCVSCHTIEQNHAIFTDHKFHNIGVGINAIEADVPSLAGAFLRAKNQGADVDISVLTDPDVSHLGRFVIDEELSSMGGFKTPTLRNIAATAPYMHDGSLKTLRDVVVHYNNGGALDKHESINAFLSGGIRPLNLDDQQIDDLVAFMEALTSPGVMIFNRKGDNNNGSNES